MAGKFSEGLAAALADDPPAGVEVVDPVEGRTAAPARRKARAPLGTTSVSMDEDLLSWLRVTAAGERGVTQRAIIRTLVAHLKAAPAAERRKVLTEALEWERELRP